MGRAASPPPSSPPGINAWQGSFFPTLTLHVNLQTVKTFLVMAALLDQHPPPPPTPPILHELFSCFGSSEVMWISVVTMIKMSVVCPAARCCSLSLPSVFNAYLVTSSHKTPKLSNTEETTGSLFQPQVSFCLMEMCTLRGFMCITPWPGFIWFF